MTGWVIIDTDQGMFSRSYGYMTGSTQDMQASSPEKIWQKKTQQENLCGLVKSVL